MKKKGLINFYELPHFEKYIVKHENPNYDINKMPFKHPFMSVIVGATGSGKSNVLMNLIKELNNTFEYIYIITQNKSEPLYEGLEEIIEKPYLTILEGIEAFNKLDIKSLPIGQSLMVFDDMCIETEKKQQKICEMYIRGRKELDKRGISCIYLTQSYYDTPNVIRKQADKVILKKINNKYDKDAIIRDGIGLDIDKGKLNDIYNYCVKSKEDITNFMLIDKGASDEYRLRKNFDEVLNVDDFL